MKVFLVKIVVEISKKFEGLEDDFLVAKFLDMELVEVVHCQVEKALSSDIVIEEKVCIGVDSSTLLYYISLLLGC